MKLKVGVIGCGGIATGRHYPVYLPITNTPKAAVSDWTVDS